MICLHEKALRVHQRVFADIHVGVRLNGVLRLNVAGIQQCPLQIRRKNGCRHSSAVSFKRQLAAQRELCAIAHVDIRLIPRLAVVDALFHIHSGERSPCVRKVAAGASALVCFKRDIAACRDVASLRNISGCLLRLVVRFADGIADLLSAHTHSEGAAGKLCEGSNGGVRIGQNLGIADGQLAAEPCPCIASAYAVRLQATHAHKCDSGTICGVGNDLVAKERLYVQRPNAHCAVGVRLKLHGAFRTGSVHRADNGADRQSACFCRCAGGDIGCRFAIG